MYPCFNQFSDTDKTGLEKNSPYAGKVFLYFYQFSDTADKHGQEKSSPYKQKMYIHAYARLINSAG